VIFVDTVELVFAGEEITSKLYTQRVVSAEAVPSSL